MFKRLFPVIVAVLASSGVAQPTTGPATMPAFRKVHLDQKGVIRWSDTDEEVALFGVNYCLPSASDYRAAGYVNADRKRLIEVDMAHLARMGFNGIRVCLWGDYQNSDAKGNLVENDHLDLADYLIAQARQRGMSILFSPIVTHSSQWPDLMREKAIGFSEHFAKNELGTNPQAIAAQANYLRQLMDHVNPYTGLALKDEPSILFVELVNEPWHHSRDVDGSIAYINALAEAAGAGRTDKLLFFNLSQDFGMADPIKRSKAPGYTIGWYPTALVAGHTRRGNFLRHVERYPELRRESVAGQPRIVYEFDAADTLSPCLYPAMVRTFRSGGVQMAAMFSYDMLATAPYNLGWQTHYLNLVYTPKKAIGAVIAAEAMRRLPRFETYGDYPHSNRFGDFRVSYEEDLAELVSDDTYLNAGDTRSSPPDPSKLRRIAGCGSSPIVSYDGTGSYFLDRIADGLWRLEVYPDAVPIADPFESMSPDKVVTRVIHRTWPMRIQLPDLGPAFHLKPLEVDGAPVAQSADGGFDVRPGVYLLSKDPPEKIAPLPGRIGHLGMREFHAPAAEVLPCSVQLLDAPDQHVLGTPLRLVARVADAEAPQGVTLWMRRLGERRFQPFPMNPARAYEYAVTLPPDALKEGAQEYCISVVAKGGEGKTFPQPTCATPRDWDFHATTFWRLTVVAPSTPVRLLQPAADFGKVSITRAGDPSTSLTVGSSSLDAALRIDRPVQRGWVPPDTTAGLYIGDRVRERGKSIEGATALRIRARANIPTTLHLTMIEKDGTGWAGRVEVPVQRTDLRVAIDALEPARGVMLPQAFPNLSTYWIEPAEGRGKSGDVVRLRDIENLQFSLRSEQGAPAPEPVTVDIEAADLTFE